MRTDDRDPAYFAKYYAEHREPIKAYVKARRVANPEMCRESDSRSREAHIEQRLENDRARHAADPATRRRHAFNANARKRVLSPDLYVEDVDPWVVFDRDLGICGICHGPINPYLPSTDQAGLSIEHVVDLAGGGEHGYANVQAAHLRCNLRQRRGDRKGSGPPLR
jgi:5-methylcytosine-specific restriction endonuclease McrA